MSSQDKCKLHVFWMDGEEGSFAYKSELPTEQGSIGIEGANGDLFNFPTQNIRYVRFSDNEPDEKKTIDIVFVSENDLIGPDNLTFVEVERAGVSIKLGEWVRRDDGYLALRIPDPEES